MRHLKAIIFGVILSAFLSKPVEAYAVDLLFPTAALVTGILASVYSAAEYQKPDSQSKDMSLTSAVLNPIGSAFVVLAACVAVSDKLYLHRDCQGVSTLMALMGMGFFIGSTVAAGLADKANNSFETTRSMIFSISSFVVSILQMARYFCQKDDELESPNST